MILCSQQKHFISLDKHACLYVLEMDMPQLIKLKQPLGN